MSKHKKVDRRMKGQIRMIERRATLSTYRFADYNVKVIELLKGVPTESVGPIEVLRGMEKA